VSAATGIAAFVGGDDVARAAGHMVHVFVDRGTGRPTPVPDGIGAALSRLAASRR
jgi:acyl-CoA thioester hydrolase